MEEGNKLKLTITGRGYLFEKEISEELADRVIILVISGKENSSSNFSSLNEQAQLSQKTTNKKKSTLQRKVLPKIEIRDEVKNMQVEPTSEKYGDYWKLSTKGNKILWLLAIAKQHNVEDLYHKEITYLSGEVGDHIESKGFSVLLEPHKRTSRILDSQNEEGVRIVRILRPWKII